MDTKFLKKNNITLLVTATTTAVSPAEHIMFMILNISKGIDLYDKAVRDGKFDSIMHMKNNNNFELANKKIPNNRFWKNRKEINKEMFGF